MVAARSLAVFCVCEGARVSFVSRLYIRCSNDYVRNASKTIRVVETGSSSVFEHLLFYNLDMSCPYVSRKTVHDDDDRVCEGAEWLATINLS